MTKRAQIGMAMFLLSDSVLFFLLILASIYFRDSGQAKLHLEASSIYTAILLASAFSIWRAASGSRGWIAVTIALGLAFLIGQSIESVALIGTTFFTLSAVYGFEVLVAIAALAAVPPAAIRAVGMYWYFLVGVWLAIFAATYLRSAL